MWPVQGTIVSDSLGGGFLLIHNVKERSGRPLGFLSLIYGGIRRIRFFIFW